MEVSHLLLALKSTLILIILQIGSYMGSCSATNSSTEYIKKSCNETLYPQLCFNSLSCYANKIQTSPKLLAISAMSVTLSATKSTWGLMQNLSKSHGLKPREAAALQDCLDVVSDSVDQFRRSMKEMQDIGYKSELQIDDILTWVSAALTDDATCSDGFAGNAMNGRVKTIAQKHINKIAHLTSIALTFINNMKQI